MATKQRVGMGKAWQQAVFEPAFPGTVIEAQLIPPRTVEYFLPPERAKGGAAGWDSPAGARRSQEPSLVFSKTNRTCPRRSRKKFRSFSACHWKHPNLVIRRVAQPGDWIIGIGPANKPTRGKLIYAMRVQEVLPLDEYFTDPRFQRKKPQVGATDARRGVGDNVYHKVRGQWAKLPGGTHTHANLKKDVSGENALAGRHFYYFGRNAVALPENLKPLTQGGQGHRSWFPQTHIQMLAEWLAKSHQLGIHGEPDGLDFCGEFEPAVCSPVPK